jgi:hypothetical protein
VPHMHMTGVEWVVGIHVRGRTPSPPKPDTHTHTHTHLLTYTHTLRELKSNPPKPDTHTSATSAASCKKLSSCRALAATFMQAPDSTKDGRTSTG